MRGPITNTETPYEKQVRLASNIENTEADLLRMKKERDAIFINCKHDWGETTPDHIYHPAYTIPGDKPGTMGVDYRGPVPVSAKTENRWKRVCKLCGKVEYTKEVEVLERKTPKWRT